jgi:hypothetical protein
VSSPAETAGPASNGRGAAKKLVLAVIDSLKPEMLDRTIAAGRAPVLGALVERGRHLPDCVAAFPSLTPVCAASIATGLEPHRHLIPSMNWYHRGEERYVEYGSSFQSAQQFGFVSQLYDTVYNLNLAHLSRDELTVFEHLDDAGLRTAGTTYLIYRGRTRQPMAVDGVYPRLARVAQLRHATWGPSELFYADLFSSRRTPCRSVLGRPGMRDQYAGCVGAHLVENDLFDFLLFSLPDNDTYSHRRGPYAQMASIAGADRALERMAHAAGGLDAFLEEHAVIVMSDHSQSAVERTTSPVEALSDWRVLAPSDRRAADVAVCPVGRFAAVYVLDPDQRERLAPRIAADLLGAEGVDLVVRRDGEEGVVAGERGELRFAPGGDLVDGRGRAWSVEGDLGTLSLTVADGRLEGRAYPDALGRVWAALECRRSGDVLVSATPGYEYADWGGFHHLGGGSHGGLDRGDSLGVLILCGLEDEPGDQDREWALHDVTPRILRHFGVWT